MTIYERLLERALSRGRGRRVVDVRIGLGYTAVALDNHSIGLAYTPLENKEGCNILPQEVVFHERPADLVAKHFLSPNLIEAAVGLATINAILNTPRDNFLIGDPLSLIELGPEDKIAMIGFFEPLVKKIKGRVQELWVFEKSEGRFSEAMSELEMAEYLPKATIAIITSVTLINKTLEEILELLENIKECILLGPSTPLLPEIFHDKKVTMLSGLVVKDPEILKVVSEAKGTKAFGPYVNKVNLKVFSTR